MTLPLADILNLFFTYLLFLLCFLTALFSLCFPRVSYNLLFSSPLRVLVFQFCLCVFCLCLFSGVGLTPEPLTSESTGGTSIG